MEYQQVEGHEGLVRDPETGAILNTNRSEIQQARARKAARKQQEQELDELKNDVSELKNLMKQVIEKLNG